MGDAVKSKKPDAVSYLFISTDRVLDVKRIRVIPESVAYGSGDGQPLTATVPVVSANYYLIRVHSYYESATFKVRGDMMP